MSHTQKAKVTAGLTVDEGDQRVSEKGVATIARGPRTPSFVGVLRPVTVKTTETNTKVVKNSA